jgi:hypothetical protein
MTLKEKFLPKMYCFIGSGMLTNTYDEKIAKQNAIECEKIADDYVVKVLDSIREYEKESGNAICDDERDSRELLEIFKKEKGL